MNILLIIGDIAEKHGLTCADLVGRKRDAGTALARQEAYYQLRQNTNLSLNRVGKVLGGRTPATVSYGYQVIARAIERRR